MYGIQMHSSFLFFFISLLLSRSQGSFFLVFFSVFQLCFARERNKTNILYSKCIPVKGDGDKRRQQQNVCVIIIIVIIIIIIAYLHVSYCFVLFFCKRKEKERANQRGGGKKRNEQENNFFVFVCVFDNGLKWKELS
ncbi:hypothetical protein Tb927.3.1650 [Trypanosoma brucei brucei TREU927]|uniref:T. brucei spp.-specific protein n=1 Tax=Trypanosoma brucei brucei (strain 927/4 GUTat10.1) TaxID=185431 RepID=Q57ZE6_TRYB2|nr:hypothetical protein Tb927.3.1650 [Trypanosoma brucei brucei TREU927]AAX80241.1 hypothetical protein Tb927.3.1650 [Trypanosoma brucei]AAZ10200.1 hypothetical protein Tb927.3.1650 [Trypanosoma brucei brucei TREU927]